MLLDKTYSVDEAIQLGHLLAQPSAVLAASVRIVPFEDDGEGYGPVVVGDRTKIREGVTLCSGARIGSDTLIGHGTVVRADAHIGDNSVVSHMVCVERSARIGSNVRISSLTHITGGCVIEDDVQIGARVATVNDNQLEWRQQPQLIPPVFRRGSRIGSGSTILGGVEIGHHSIVGAGAVVTRSLPARVLAYGVPAYIRRDL